MSSPPIPRDVQDFQFKLVSRFKIFNKTEDFCTGPINALAISSKHGLAFVGSPSEIQILETSVLLENRISKGSGADVEVFPRLCIPLPSRPSHIGISCDQLHVAVALAPKDTKNCAVALIYPISSFTSKDPSPAWELRLSSTPGVTVRDLVWNPGLPQLLCICLSNGSVAVYELKGTSQTFQIFSLPETTLALSVSWSPKGKQLVIGSANGTLSQYKPDLKQVKTIPAPPPNPSISSTDGNIAPVSLLWLSSFQFAVVYGNITDNGSGTNRPGLHIVNAPKGGAVSYLNYDDICYSSGELRPIQYYLTHQQKWNVLLMSSANSTEVGVLAADGSGVEPLVWEQWALEDASRAELPLSASREEMYAIGMAIDTSPSAPLPWGENQTIPPAPILVLLSHHGLLCTFNMINLRPGAAQDLCSPPELIPGIREAFVNLGPPSSAVAQLAPATVSTPLFGAIPGIGSSTPAPAFPMTTKPSFSFAPSSQTPSSLFSNSPSNQSFASLAAAANTPSVFGSQPQKVESEKGWLSGQGGNTFGGFGSSLSQGSLGSILSQPKEEPTSSALSTAFSFASSNASTVIQAATTAASITVAPPASQPQNVTTFSFAEQSQSLPVTQSSGMAAQASPLAPAQNFSSFGASMPLAQKPLAVDKNKMGGLPGGLATTGKLKFVSAVPENGGSNVSGGLSMGSPNQVWTGSSPGLTIPKVTANVPKTEVQTVPSVTNIVPSQPQAAPSPVPTVSDAAIFFAICQETELFEKELAQLKERDGKLNIEIGTPMEKQNLVQKVDAMDNFLRELSETTHGQASEITALRTLLVEAFAWVEEARSRQLYSKNPRYLHLAMNQGLDPVIKKHLLAIRNRIHYLDTQLQQVDFNLDNQWSTFQNSCKKRSRTKHDWVLNERGYNTDNLQRKEIRMPSLEYVYQSILSQQQVIEKHKACLDELEAKLRDRAKWELGTSLYAASSGFKPRKKRSSPPNHKRSSVGEQDLSRMAESLLALQLGGSKLDGGYSAQFGSKNPLLPKKMSSRHVSQLCHLLAHRPMARVIPSSRGISSSIVLPFPSNLGDPITVSPPKTQALTYQNLSSTISSVGHSLAASSKTSAIGTPSASPMPSAPAVISSQSLGMSSPGLGMSSPGLGVPSQALGMPSQSSGISAQALSMSSQLLGMPTQTLGMSASVVGVPSQSLGMSSQSLGMPAQSLGMPAQSLGMAATAPFSSGSSLGQSILVMNFATPSSSSSAHGFSAPGMGSLAISSINPPKSSAAGSASGIMLSVGTSIQDKSSLPSVIGHSIPAASSSPSTINLTSPLPASLATPVSSSAPAFNTHPSTKSSSLQTSSGSMFGGIAPNTVSSASSEGNVWPFSPSGSFSIGSSSKPGGISTGKPVIPPTAASSPFVPTTTTVATSPPAFTLNFSIATTQAAKPFTLGSKPLTTNSSFTLPTSTFGSQSISTPLAKEPLFVFGGNTLGSSIKPPVAVEESTAEGKEEEIKKEEEKEVEVEDNKEETISVKTDVVAENKEISKQETTDKVQTFSFASAFGNSPLSFGKSPSSILPPTSSVTITATPVATVQSPEYEAITPENKTENDGKEKSEEKPAPARSLFQEFNFKLSGNKSEVFGGKPTASIFGGSTTITTTTTATTSQIAVPIFGSPSSSATLQTPTVTTSAAIPLPIISQSEPPTTTANPLSSLGNIVASLGTNTFNKSTTAETTKPSTFSTFSFALPPKDEANKSLTSDVATTSPNDSQKTPIKTFPATSPPADTTSAASPGVVSSSSGPTDFGQGLANILGQSLPSSSPSTQPQSVQNPFAGTSGLFGPSGGSSSPSATLFGKPSDGTPTVGLFGQPLKQEGSTTSFFGSPSSATPATTSEPTFGSGSVFGQAASTSASVFGGNGFGSSKPVFGQSIATGFSLSGSVFGQNVGTSSTSTSLFCSPPASTSGSSPFQTPATASSSVFGSSTSGENRNLFGSVAQSGFGSPTSSFQAKPGGFGGSPVFGAMASGSTSPSFGGSATFGSPPAFSSHVFGSPGDAVLAFGGAGGSVFGSGLTSQGAAPSSTFENLATAQTLTFGNLAQSGSTGGPFSAVPGATAPQPQDAFGSAAGASTGGGSSSFGGSSFTSWR